MRAKAITTEEMIAIERKAREVGITPLLLMENAGRAVAEVVLSMHPKSVRVLAGAGNNGGDGFVAARHLLAAGIDTKVYLLGNVRKVRKKEARINLEILRQIRKDLIVYLSSRAEVLKAKRDIKAADVIVDAILGTGIRGELREPIATVVQLVNSTKTPVVAVDVPTGVDPTTGEVAKNAIMATKTVSFHAVKRGLLKAKKFSGKIIVAELGIPRELFEKIS